MVLLLFSVSQFAVKAAPATRRLFAFAFLCALCALCVSASLR
jgi:hypothetical protein